MRAQTLMCCLALATYSRALAEPNIESSQIEGLVLGWTIPQKDIFYSAPTLAARLGAGAVSGPSGSRHSSGASTVPSAGHQFTGASD